MPFITSELWNNTGIRGERLINASWPQNARLQCFGNLRYRWVIELIGSIRSLRAEMNLPAGARTDGKEAARCKYRISDAFGSSSKPLSVRWRGWKIFAGYNGEVTPDMVQSVFREALMLVPLKAFVDFAAERERLQKELAALEQNLAGYERKLANPSFVERAPKAVVDEEKRRVGPKLWTIRPRLKKPPCSALKQVRAFKALLRHRNLKQML